MFSRFIVVSIDLQAGHGYVRQQAAAQGSILECPIKFDIRRASQITDHGAEGLAYSMASPAVARRKPEVGMELVGTIAHDCVYIGQLALDADGDHFLRNWAYADQFDAAEQGLEEFDDEPVDFEEPDDEPDVYDDECVSSTEVYNRAHAHFGNHEMAREAAEMYPGDFM